MSKSEKLREAEEKWQYFGGLLPFGREQISTLHICEVDPTPEADSKGWRRAEGYKVAWEGVILPEWTNFVGGLDGGIAAWLVDNCTSATIVGIHTPTFWGPPMISGVSINIEISYIKAAPLGTKIRVSTEIIRLSDSLANIKCEISDWDTGKLFILGHHLKTWKAPTPKAKL